MKIPSYLSRNKYGIFYFRRAIPTDLKEAIGQSEIVRSLKSREPREAIQLGRIIAFRVENWFNSIREDQVNKKNKNVNNKEDDLVFDYTVEIDFPDGSKANREITPEDIKAWAEAGLSPEQIENILKPNLGNIPPSNQGNIDTETNFPSIKLC